MKRYLLRRIIGMTTVLLIVSIAVFGLMNLVPGDPIVARYGEDSTLTKEQENALRHQYGLDRPLPVQYAKWLHGVLTLDLGRSITQRRPVSEMIAERLPVTMQVQGFAFVLILALALPAGIVSAVFRNSMLDRVVSVAALAGVAMPAFWLGILLIIVFAVNLGWLPVSGFVSLTSDPVGALRFSLLPALTAALGGTAAVVMRQTRSALLEVLDQDYVRTARAKGLRERKVIVAHALRNAMLPVATALGLAIGQLLAGSVIIERRARRASSETAGRLAASRRDMIQEAAFEPNGAPSWLRWSPALSTSNGRLRKAQETGRSLDHSGRLAVKPSPRATWWASSPTRRLSSGWSGRFEVNSTTSGRPALAPSVQSHSPSSCHRLRSRLRPCRPRVD